MKYIIKDWMNNVCFKGKKFNSFDDAWSFIYENDPNLNNDDHWFDDYYVEAIK